MKRQPIILVEEEFSSKNDNERTTKFNDILLHIIKKTELLKIS